MFTGIIEEIGIVKSISTIPGGIKITIGATSILDDLAVDHSVAVSGVCLTVIELKNRSFAVEAVGETLAKSTIKNLKSSDVVNLERAMKLGDRLGGHLVQGHVNGVGTISKVVRRGDNWYIEVDIPETLDRYVIPEGSIAVDGISLTVASLEGTKVGLSIIPHTFKNTTLSRVKVGNTCNIETDLIGKYLEKWLNNSSNHSDKQQITSEWLQSKGF